MDGKAKIKKTAMILLMVLLLFKMTAAAEEESNMEAGKAVNGSIFTEVSNMTLEEKVAQMFIITPDALTGAAGAAYAGDDSRNALRTYPVGGLVFFESNIQSKEQITEMISALQSYSIERIGLPLFTCVDEEGGRVARIAGRGIMETPVYESMYAVGSGCSLADAYGVGRGIGTYLKELGFNVDFAPVADIWSNSSNTVIGDRAFGTSGWLAGPMVSTVVKGLKEAGVLATLKHFPGHGDTAEDSHSGFAYTYKTLEELREEEFIPFSQGIEAGADLVMVGHISVPNVLGSDVPSSLSYQIVTELLRGELGFHGLVVTDALNMGAVTCTYSPAEAAVEAVCAGVDLILMPADFYSAYEGVVNAVRNGEISEERIDESVIRIVTGKRLIGN